MKRRVTTILLSLVALAAYVAPIAQAGGFHP